MPRRPLHAAPLLRIALVCAAVFVAGPFADPAIARNVEITDIRPTAKGDARTAAARRRPVCTVTLGDTAGVEAAEKFALLYCIFTLDMPDDCRDPTDRVISESDDAIQQFAGWRADSGMVIGGDALGNSLSPSVVLSVMPDVTPKGKAGVRVQLWGKAGGKWSPRSEIVERTLQLGEDPSGPVVAVTRPAATEPVVVRPPVQPPNDLEAKGWMEMADNYLRINMPDKARIFLQRVIDKYPDSEYGKKARAKLAEIK